jgi:hypothetical protein
MSSDISDFSDGLLDIYDPSGVTVRSLERDSTKGLTTMAFKSIGTLAGDVLLKVEATAAHANKLRNKLNEVGVSTPGGQQVETPMRSASEGVGSTRNGMRKEARAETRASSDRGGMRQTARRTAADTDEAHMRPVLRLVMGNREGCTAPPNNRSRPTPAVHLSLVLGGRHSTSSGVF